MHQVCEIEDVKLTKRQEDVGLMYEIGGVKVVGIA